MKRLLIFCFLPALFACKNDKEPITPVSDEVTFSAAIDITKASFDKSAFAQGDKIAVWITDNATLKTQYNYVDKATFEYDATKSVFVVPSGETKITYPQSNSSLKFWAMMPSSLAPNAFKTGNVTDWSIVADQSTATGYTNSDLMIAQNTVGATYGGTVPTLSFYHRLTRFVVNVASFPASYKGANLTSMSVVVKSKDKVSVQMVAATDVAVGTAVASGNDIEVKMNKFNDSPSKYEAIIAPASFKKGDVIALVKAVYGAQEVVFPCVMPEGKILAPKEAYEMTVNVASSFEVKVDFTVKPWDETLPEIEGGLTPTV